MKNEDAQDNKEIGLDIAKFSSLINENYVYVDKTDFVHKILIGPRKNLFLSRPRRFGKTLLIDTIEEAAIGRKELFSGLAIDGLRGDGEWPRSHVLRISMNSFGDDPALLDKNLTGFLHSFAEERRFSVNAENAAFSLREVIRTLRRNYTDIPLITENTEISDGLVANKKEIVVLIDEYDAPIINNINNKTNLKLAKLTLHGFYNSLKSCENMVDRIFVTGITKFSQLSLFSALNNLEDISFNQDYAAVCGFTFDEIYRFYSKNPETCLSIMQDDNRFGPGFTSEKLMARIHEWYDGYSWDGDIRVINPLSFQKLLAKQEFSNFWTQTGGTNLIDQFHINEKIFASLFKGKTRFSGSMPIQDAGKINPVALMLQTGYLSVRSQRIFSNLTKLYLTIPNREVGTTVMEDYVNSRVFPAISGIDDGFTPKRCKEFCQAFCQNDNDKAEKLLQGFLSLIPDKLHLEHEAFYHVILLSIFRATDFTADFDAGAETKNSNCIIDLVVVSPNHGFFVVEIKYSKSLSESVDGPGAALKATVLSTKDDENLNKCVKDAFTQILNKGYLTPYLTGELPVYATAVAVCGRNHVRIRSCPAEELLAKTSEFLDSLESGQPIDVPAQTNPTDSPD
ncbi:MAG: AAA family ATPase [Deltaproteobacteria bacterium]|nr:AAA family ATPase [Deltaproteobacteria bacterium]